MSVDKLVFQGKFDTIFTNATLHWVADYQSGIKDSHIALKKNGRFVGEFGGYGNIATLVKIIENVFTQNKEMGIFNNPWFFPKKISLKNT